MSVDEFEQLQAMMDIAMMLEARNVAWQDEGGKPWGCRNEANAHVGWIGSKNNIWAWPNAQAPAIDVNQLNPIVHPKFETKLDSGTTTTTCSSGLKTNSRWISNEEWADR